MYFQHSGGIWRDFPALVPGVLYAEGITAGVTAGTDRFETIAKARLADGPEAELPEIQAWRRAFATMGLKPTQYRCAAESLLRRFRKEGSLPRLHPLVDLCNAVSLAYAIPVAVFDAARAGQAHARRWTNRQSGRSAVRDSTTAVLIVAEALHEEAPACVRDLTATLAAELTAVWPVRRQSAVLAAAEPRFTFGG